MCPYGGFDDYWLYLYGMRSAILSLTLSELRPNNCVTRISAISVLRADSFTSGTGVLTVHVGMLT
ncbi:hypothetical protein ARMSODRAFT_960985 [Armillaria solidipes]|uniref:Uncharacterized protein n=1 Tax=Armillaria solidipes TaxID=1076256 RepID=A0A2H3BRB0_9AGAR|nr:hypothetical protein ARMSODRAFT_960985 [Armillaria solidipes]